MSTGVIRPLKSGGVAVDIGEDFPVWQPDTGAARRYLLDRDIAAAATRSDASDPRRAEPAPCP